MTNRMFVGYITRLQKALASVDYEVVARILSILETAEANGRSIFIAGNGGSAANASHFAVDLGKLASDRSSRCFRAISLSDCVPWITASSNDSGYNSIFARQLQSLSRPEDVLICVSVSGRSPNILAAIQWARTHKLVTVLLSGAPGVPLGDLAHSPDVNLIIPECHYGVVEDVHMAVLHMLCYSLAKDETLL